MTVNEIKVVSSKIGIVATNSTKRVNWERVEMAMEVQATTGNLKLGMLGHYLSSDRHEKFRRLLKSKTAQQETFSKEDFLAVRNNLMLRLLIRNVKRADLPKLKRKIIEKMKVKKGDKWTEYQTGEHKAAPAGI